MMSPRYVKSAVVGFVEGRAKGKLLQLDGGLVVLQVVELCIGECRCVKVNAGV